MYTKIILFIVTALGISIYLNYSPKNDNTPTHKNKVVAITQIAPHSSLDRIRKGIEDEIIKEFGDKGRWAAHEEMKQLHDRIVFKPIAI